jgi:hypothetical protein
VARAIEEFAAPLLPPVADTVSILSVPDSTELVPPAPPLLPPPPPPVTYIFTVVIPVGIVQSPEESITVMVLKPPAAETTDVPSAFV